MLVVTLSIDIIYVHVRADLAYGIICRGYERLVAMAFNQVQAVSVLPDGVRYVGFCIFIQSDFHDTFLLFMFQARTWQYYCQYVACVVK